MLAWPLRATGDQLQITSTPSGAAVEIDGLTSGTKPFGKRFSRWTFSQHEDFAGLAPRACQGRAHQSRRLRHTGAQAYGSPDELDLYQRAKSRGILADQIRSFSWGSATHLRDLHWHCHRHSLGHKCRPSTGTFTRGPRSPNEDCGRVSKRSGLLRVGGFFVTGTDVIVTNAHLARDEERLHTLLSNGRELEGRVVYIDADLDIALVKVVAGAGESELPHLALADAGSVRQGEDVLAVGNPGDAMLFSVPKGIVSAVGKFPSAGLGTWIQVDTPINPGNRGGPLLNSRGEVMGSTTQKFMEKNATGIGFALSASDVLEVLHRFYPNVASARQPTTKTAFQPTTRESSQFAEPSNTSCSVAPEGVGTITIMSDPDSAEIFVDDKLFGNAPATLKLSGGSHAIILKFPG